MAERRPERDGEARASLASSPGPKANGGLVVERVTHQEVPAIGALYKKVWDGERTGLAPELVKTWQPTPLEFTSWMEGVTYFAARRDARVVGVIGCEVRHGSGRLVHLVVDPEFRRLGIGSALVTTSLDWARRANVPEVWVDMLARFEAAAGLFRHLGFVECGLLHRHQWNEDVRLFERLL